MGEDFRDFARPGKTRQPGQIAVNVTFKDPLVAI
jgi:hypothetical protein